MTLIFGKKYTCKHSLKFLHFPPNFYTLWLVLEIPFLYTPVFLFQVGKGFSYRADFVMKFLLKLY